MALTARQRRFVDAKTRGATNKAAAILAGYSAATASAAGARLAKHPAVVAELAKRKPKAGKSKKDSAEQPAQPPAAQPETPPPVPAGSVMLAMQHKDPKTFLMAVMNDIATDIKLRTDAAKALMPFEHQKLGEGGKKDAKNEAAKKVAAGRFATAAPPLTRVK